MGQYFPNLDHQIYWHLFLSHDSRNEKTKSKDGKQGQREKRSRKQAAERGATNSSNRPEEIALNLGSSPQNQLPDDKRGPTIPRNTGQRYSSILSPQGAESRHHITFPSHN